MNDKTYEENKLETAKIALQNNLPMEIIIKLTGLTEAEIHKVNKSLEMVD